MTSLETTHVERGLRAWPARFTDRLTGPTPSWWKAIRALASGSFRPKEVDAESIPITRGALPRATTEQLAVTWAGHASFVVQIGGQTILTDPVWSEKIPAIRRRTPVGVAWSDLPPIDAVVISHNHYDHLDAPTIDRLPRSTTILAPGGVGRWFARRGFTNIVELDWYEETTVGSLTAAFVPAHHWSRRGLFDTCASLWGGWVLTDNSHRLYFAGDTGYGHYFRDIASRYGNIDVALMPVGAYSPRSFLQPWHMNPEEAVKACDELGARHMGTMHWGTFVLSGEPFGEPVIRARAAWEAAGRNRADLWDFTIGETRFVE